MIDIDHTSPYILFCKKDMGNKSFMSQLEREWSKGAKKGINFNQRTGSLLHLVQSLKASLKTRSPSLCVKGPTVRVQLEDFQLVLDDFVQAFFPQSFQAVSVLPCSGSQTRG